MAFSVIPVLHNYADKNGLQKVNLQIIYNRLKVYYPTDVKVQAKEFADGQVIKHAQKNKFNLLIKGTKREIEDRLLDALNKGVILTRQRLSDVVSGADNANSKGRISDYIYELIDSLKGTLSPKRLLFYKYTAEKIERFSPSTVFPDVSTEWINRFEQFLRKTGNAHNTVVKDIGLLLTILHKAEKAELIELKQFKNYKRPTNKQTAPSYLSVEELDKFFNLIKTIEHPKMRLAGYYYALSCYTGYRLSDAKRFNPEDVRNGRLVLRATKNGTLVSTPIFPRLQEIIDEIGGRPFTVREQTAREYLRDMFEMIGITREFASPYHSSRHTYAMQLMKKGLSRDEVAELIGDTTLVAKIYARIENTALSDKLMKIFA